MTVPTEGKDLKNFVGGEWVNSTAEKRIDVPNPATGEPMGTVPLSTKEDLDQAAKAEEILREFGFLSASIQGWCKEAVIG